jgi:hypothetical protein
VSSLRRTPINDDDAYGTIFILYNCNVYTYPLADDRDDLMRQWRQQFLNAGVEVKDRTLAVYLI